MPMINVEYDDAKVNESEIKKLCEEVQKVVSSVTGIEDVFVYANSSQVKVKVAPIEIWVRLTAAKIKNIDDLIIQIKNRLSDWKKQVEFPHPINLSIIPMDWKVEIDI